MKQCNTCGEVKPLSEYSRNRGGRLARCKPCAKPSAQDRLKAHLKHTYGLTYEEWDGMVRKQAGRCGICNDAPADRDLVVDHCHATGRVRELLCRQCNIAAGAVRDDPTTARQLANYLEKYND
jgi:hypothetical protein